MTRPAVSLVFVPGFLCDSRLFTHQIEVLDRRSDIASVSVADVTQDDTIEAMASRLLADVDGRTAIAGLSMGAIVAAVAAHMAPTRTVGLCLMATNLNAPDRVQIERRREWQRLARSGDMKRVVQEEISVALTAEPERVLPTIESMAATAGPEQFQTQNHALLHRCDRRELLTRFESPTLIVCGEADTICPPEVHRDLARRIPRAHLEVIRGAGHLLTLDRPDAASEALAGWLDSVTDDGRSIRSDAGSTTR